MENYPSYLRIPTWKMWGAFLAATIGCFAFMDPIYERLGYQADYPGIRTYLSPPYQVFWLFSFAYLVGLFINLKILLRKIIYYFRRSFRDLSIQEKYARFEDIESVKVGLLKFKPTLVLKDGHYIGPGKEIVEAILGEKLQWETGLTLT